ncbi:MAG: hypothetical protein SFV17_05655 [Candidatus Obscuribacter sp.]|nr:hypothetical protein [Candidatus Melainabacteria bacterium]MDX1986152.1 hypothetical protein [Candidatus Obscuribacter sp.]
MSYERNRQEALSCQTPDAALEAFHQESFHVPILPQPKEDLKKVEDVLWPPQPKIDLSNSERNNSLKIDPSFTEVSTFSAEEIPRVREKVIKSEGVKDTVYKDSRGIATIGVGFNLEQPGAREAIEYLGADYEQILAGKASLSEKQIKTLNDISLANAMMQAEEIYPNMAKLPFHKRAVIVDLAYNLGGDKLDNEFVDFSAAIRKGNTKQAANELVGTPYARQVGARAQDNIRALKE